jgi:hypothetical protein
MAKKVRVLIPSVVLLLSSCAVIMGTPEERSQNFDDWRLCHELADFTFKYDSEWIWHISNEVEKRNLINDEQCISVYQSRMSQLMKKYNLNATPLTFKEALKNKKSSDV